MQFLDVPTNMILRIYIYADLMNYKKDFNKINRTRRLMLGCTSGENMLV